MKLTASDVDGLELGVRHLDLVRVGALVEPGVDLKPGAGRGAGDQVDDRLQRDRGLPRQFIVMNENRRCSILFHFEVPGGK